MTNSLTVLNSVVYKYTVKPHKRDRSGYLYVFVQFNFLGVRLYI